MGKGPKLPRGGAAEMLSGAVSRHTFEKCYSVCTDFIASG